MNPDPNLQPVFGEADDEPQVKPSGPQRPFQWLIDKHGIDPTEAAALREFMPLDHDMITEPEFLALREKWRQAPVEEM